MCKVELGPNGTMGWRKSHLAKERRALAGIQLSEHLFPQQHTFPHSTRPSTQHTTTTTRSRRPPTPSGAVGSVDTCHVCNRKDQLGRGWSNQCAWQCANGSNTPKGSPNNKRASANTKAERFEKAWEKTTVPREARSMTAFEDSSVSYCFATSRRLSGFMT